jgi:hypothetical protein
LLKKTEHKDKDYKNDESKLYVEQWVSDLKRLLMGLNEPIPGLWAQTYSRVKKLLLSIVRF